MHYELLQTDDGTETKENAIKFLHFLLENKIYIREMNIETLDFIPCHGPFFLLCMHCSYFFNRM